MAKPLLTPEELEESKPLLTAAELEGATPAVKAPVRAVDKKTGLPLVSPQLGARSEQLSDEERKDKYRHAFGSGNLSDVGFTQFVKEVLTGTDPDSNALISKDPGVRMEAIKKLGERDLGMIGGVAMAGRSAAKAAAEYAAPKVGLNAFAQSSAKAIANSAGAKIKDAAIAGLDKIWGIGPLLGLGANAAIDAAPALARGAAAGAKVVAPVVVPAVRSAVVKAVSPAEEPRPFRGVWSNAVERLRASSAGNPRAQELLSRIDAIPDSGAGTGTVTQGTLGE